MVDIDAEVPAQLLGFYPALVSFIEALGRILPMQREDFEGLFRAMAGCPVIIRLLDPPLHEFLPSRHDLVQPGHRPCKGQPG